MRKLANVRLQLGIHKKSRVTYSVFYSLFTSPLTKKKKKASRAGVSNFHFGMSVRPEWPKNRASVENGLPPNFVTDFLSNLSCKLKFT